MERSTKRQFLLSAVILLYWIVYYIQDHLANLGDYRVFPYRFHEIYPIGTVFLPAATLIWLLVLAVRTVRSKNWQKNGALLAVLLVLTAAQVGFIRFQRQRISVTTVAEVVEITDEYHIVLDNGKERITLKTSPLVPPLLAENTRYVFTYDTVKSRHDQGRLLRASLID